MPEAWSPNAWKSNEISWDGVFAEDGREIDLLDHGGLSHLSPLIQIFALGPRSKKPGSAEFGIIMKSMPIAMRACF